MKAASDAYLQKSVLYKNGLTEYCRCYAGIVLLNRAETDRDIPTTMYGRHCLLKAAATGDFGLFENEILRNIIQIFPDGLNQKCAQKTNIHFSDCHGFIRFWS